MQDELLNITNKTNTVLNQSNSDIERLLMGQFTISKPTPPTRYAIDTSKIKTIEDVVSIIGVLDISVTENVKGFEQVKHLLSKIE